MDEINFVDFVKNALDKYDTQYNKYNRFIEHNNVSIDDKIGIIIFNNIENVDYNKYTCELLAYFENDAKIWVWAWLSLRLENNFNELSRGLLNHGLTLSPSSNSEDHYMIKSFLINSRIQINDKVQLDINLAICSKLLKDNILFIYPRTIYIDKTKDKSIILFYLIKKKYND
jgi:hypothetical protein